MVPSQDLLRREVLAKFGWQMGRSTLSKILTMDWKALNVGSHRNPNMKRKRKPLFPDFEDDLVKYIGVHVAQHEALASEAASEDIMGIPSSSVNAGVVVLDDKPALPNEMSKLPALQPRNGHVLTEAIILEEAQRLKQLHGIKDEQLVLSVGWLARFKHRNGIRLRKASGSNVAQTHKPPPGLTARSATIPSELFEAPTASSLQHGSAIESTAPVSRPSRCHRSESFYELMICLLVFLFNAVVAGPATETASSDRAPFWNRSPSAFVELCVVAVDCCDGRRDWCKYPNRLETVLGPPL